MAGFQLLDVTPTPDYVLDAEAERKQPLDKRIQGEISMLQHIEHEMSPNYRRFLQNVKARLHLIQKDVAVLVERNDRGEETTG